MIIISYDEGGRYLENDKLLLLTSFQSIGNPFAGLLFGHTQVTYRRFHFNSSNEAFTLESLYHLGHRGKKIVKKTGQPVLLINLVSSMFGIV